MIGIGEDAKSSKNISKLSSTVHKKGSYKTVNLDLFEGHKHFSTSANQYLGYTTLTKGRIKNT